MSSLIAKWVSKSGKYWLELYEDAFGFHYYGSGCCGNYGSITAQEAITRAEKTAQFVQPDKAKTPMRRII